MVNDAYSHSYRKEVLKITVLLSINYICEKVYFLFFGRALSNEDIVSRAISKVGEVGYNIMFSNCEHFANWCRYNIQRSEQVGGPF